MPEGRPSEYLAECFWPGVHDADLQLLDNRVHAVVADLARSGEQIHYLNWAYAATGLAVPASY